jgi:hypothetical protein
MQLWGHEMNIAVWLDAYYVTDYLIFISTKTVSSLNSSLYFFWISYLSKIQYKIILRWKWNLESNEGCLEVSQSNSVEFFKKSPSMYKQNFSRSRIDNDYIFNYSQEWWHNHHFKRKKI